MDDFKKFVSEGRITKVVGKTGMLSLKGKQLQAARAVHQSSVLEDKINALSNQVKYLAGMIMLGTALTDDNSLLSRSMIFSGLLNEEGE